MITVVIAQVIIRRARDRHRRKIIFGHSLERIDTIFMVELAKLHNLKRPFVYKLRDKSLLGLLSLGVQKLAKLFLLLKVFLLANLSAKINYTEPYEISIEHVDLVVFDYLRKVRASQRSVT